MIPSALEHVQEIAGGSGRAAVFLDYDGTLTPIVSQPEDAWLSDSMRQTLLELAARAPVVAILSGRDLDDVRRRVNIDAIVYAGSHGFDIAGPHGLRRQMATEFLPTLDMAEKELHEALDGISGARVERKRFSIAAHRSALLTQEFRRGGALPARAHRDTDVRQTLLSAKALQGAAVSSPPLGRSAAFGRCGDLRRAKGDRPSLR